MSTQSEIATFAFTINIDVEYTILALALLSLLLVSIMLYICAYRQKLIYTRWYGVLQWSSLTIAVLTLLLWILQLFNS